MKGILAWQNWIFEFSVIEKPKFQISTNSGTRVEQGHVRITNYILKIFLNPLKIYISFCFKNNF